MVNINIVAGHLTRSSGVNFKLHLTNVYYLLFIHAWTVYIFLCIADHSAMNVISISSMIIEDGKATICRMGFCIVHRGWIWIHGNNNLFKLLF